MTLIPVLGEIGRGVAIQEVKIKGQTSKVLISAAPGDRIRAAEALVKVAGMQRVDVTSGDQPLKQPGRRVMVQVFGQTVEL
jgi:hypothetical protein